MQNAPLLFLFVKGWGGGGLRINGLRHVLQMLFNVSDFDLCANIVSPPPYESYATSDTYEPPTEPPPPYESPPPYTAKEEAS